MYLPRSIRDVLERMKFIPSATRFLVLFALIAGSFSVQLHAQQGNSDPKMSQSEMEGKKLFIQRCSICHLPRLNDPTVPDAFGPSLNGKVNGTADEARVREVIMKGTPRMPGFQYSFQTSQVDQIIAFMKTLK